MDLDNNEPVEADKEKRVLERSAAYPGSTIEYTIEFVAALKKSFQKGKFKREDIMAVLKRGSTGVKRDISAAAQYGLVDKAAGTGYKLTSLAEHILQPYSPEEKLDNVGECFRNPKLYQSLIETYKGQVLPTDEVLKVVLIRQHGITSVAAPQAVEIFIQNADYAGLLNSQRVLMPSGSQELSAPAVKNEDSSGSDEPNKSEDSYSPDPVGEAPSASEYVAQKALPTPQSSPNVSSNTLEVTIHLTERKVARLIYPDNMKEKDLKILTLQLEQIALTFEQ
ncbi:hypothetical protein [Spirosoma sp.]|uniref:hypothetical protein n=1 Tax=Spirosoma sp. TaxID=1899569 RepID=UPI003B3BA739